MIAVRVFSGASLFALLIMDICCVPIKKGINPGDFDGGSYANTASNFGSNQGAPSGHYSPGVVVPDRAPTGVSTHYQLVPQEPGFSQPAVHRQPAAPAVQRPPAAPAGPSFPSAGYRGSAVRQNPAGALQPETASQPGPSDTDWAVPPSSLFRGGEETSAGLGSSTPENVSPPLPPPGPVYQAGILSHYEQTSENGDSEMQTEEQGFMYAPPPPPVNVPAGQGFAGQGFASQSQVQSQPQPELGSWGMYPYYDFMFLTGQYPPGTVTYSSQSSEQGSDSWQDVHYVKEFAPYNPGPADQVETVTGDFTAPQTFGAPMQPVMAAHGPGGAQPVLQPASSYGHFTQPGRFDAPTHGQAGGYNMRKI